MGMGWIILGYSLLAILGAWMLRAGARGTLLSDHPFCRRCIYDLFGQPADSTRCPECGADLHARRAFQHGMRRRRWGISIFGMIMLATALVLGGRTIGRPLVFGEPQQKLTWVLILEPKSYGTAQSLVGMLELLDRNRSGSLSTWQRKLVARIALDWNGGWTALRFGRADGNGNAVFLSAGDLIEQSRQDQWLSDADYARYMRQGLRPTLTARRHVQIGDPLPFWLGAMQGEAELKERSDGQVQWTRRVTASVKRVEVDGIPTTAPAGVIVSLLGTARRNEVQATVTLPPGVTVKPPTSAPSTLPAAPTGLAGASPAALASLGFAPAGPNAVKVMLDVIVQEFPSVPGMPSRIISRFDLPVDGAFQLEPPGVATVQTYDSTSQFIPIDPGQARVWINEWEPSRRLWLTLEQTPELSAAVGRYVRSGTQLPLAGQVKVRVGNREYSGGTVLVNNGIRPPRLEFPIAEIDADAEDCDVWIEPAMSVAAATVDIERMWNETVALGRVPIKSLDSRMHVSRAAQRGFWSKGRALIVGMVTDLHYDAHDNASAGMIRPVALLAGDINVGARHELPVRRDGRLPDQGIYSLMMIEPAESGKEWIVGAADYGFLQDRSRQTSYAPGSPTGAGRIAPIMLDGLADPMLKDMLRVTQKMREAAGESQVIHSSSAVARINLLESGVGRNVGIPDHISAWTGEGRPAVLLGSVRQIKRNADGEARSAVLHPLLCLAGQFDPSAAPALQVAFIPQRNAFVAANDLVDGSLLLAVVRIHDSDRTAIHAAIIDEPAPFMPNAASIVRIDSETDPRVISAINALQKR